MVIGSILPLDDIGSAPKDNKCLSGNDIIDTPVVVGTLVAPDKLETKTALFGLDDVS